MGIYIQEGELWWESSICIKTGLWRFLLRPVAHYMYNTHRPSTGERVGKKARHKIKRCWTGYVALIPLFHQPSPFHSSKSSSSHLTFYLTREMSSSPAQITPHHLQSPHITSNHPTHPSKAATDIYLRRGNLEKYLVSDDRYLMVNKWIKRWISEGKLW